MGFSFPLSNVSQILVEGTVGDDFTGDIAIDDVSFLGCEPYEGNCDTIRQNLIVFLTPNSQSYPEL